MVGRSLAGVSLRDREQSSRFIVLATASVVVYSVALPLLRLYSIATDPSEEGRTVYAVAAMACYLPLQVWLVLSAAHDAPGPGRAWALAAMAAVIDRILPGVRVPWVGSL